MLKRIFVFLGVSFILLAAVGGVAGYWAWNYVTRDLPDFQNVEDYQPPAVSTLFARDGTPVAEFFDERRYMVRIGDVPLHVRNAFLAAEDASFYRHQGIDPISILRAAVKNTLSGSARQGASTITQQVVKNLLLSPEKKLMRKIKEAILSYRIERRLSKDDILEIYLNQIFFGNKAYGLKSAARSYFRKEVQELSVAEAALLAGLPKAPTSYSPINNFRAAKNRQEHILNLMLKERFITEAQRDAAKAEKLSIFRASEANLFAAPYYAAEVRRLLSEQWPTLSIDRDGLRIYAALDLNAQRDAERALQRGLREVDKRRGWRGPLQRGVSAADFSKQFSPVAKVELDTLYPARVVEISRGGAGTRVTIDLNGVRGLLDLKSGGWAKKRLNPGDRVTWITSFESELRVGDVIEVSARFEAPKPDPKRLWSGDGRKIIEGQFILDQTPEIEGAITILNPHNGEVVAIVGGYSYQRNQFNRVTQSYRQPGSTFKPVVYLAAVDGFNYTPSTIVHDSPRTFRVGDTDWTPGNYDGKFLGGIPLRVALERSRNLVSVDIVSKIGLDAVIQYAKRLGIESRLGRNPSISLGSSEVTVLELSRSYGVFAAKGVLNPSVLITRIEDRYGKVLFDHRLTGITAATQAIDENSAFIMAHMMEGVVQRGTGYKVKELGRPVAGKTGTSNDQMDTWFIGYTPQWVCGVWVGFDQKKEIGDKETGGRVAAPIFVYAMGPFLERQDSSLYQTLSAEAARNAEELGIEFVPPSTIEAQDFPVPPGVDPYWVEKDSGIATAAGSPGAIIDYFKRGTSPPRAREHEDEQSMYLESPEI